MATRFSSAEPFHCLAHGRARDAQLGGDSLFVDEFTGLDLARDDLFAQDRVDLIA